MSVTIRTRRRASLAAGLLSVLVLGLCAAPADGSVGSKTHYRAICANGTGTTYGCHGLADHDSNSSHPNGWTPEDLAAQYDLAQQKAAFANDPQKVAVVVAYDYPSAAHDLSVYRTTFGLPRCGSRCFTKLDQDGGTKLPDPDPGYGWSSTAASALQMVSAVCPACSLELVEADGSVFVDLEAAVATAAQTADVVVAPFGTTERRQLISHARAFTYKGHPIVVSAGNSAYSVPPQFPASAPRVIAVGGTRFVVRGQTVLEAVDPHTTSGCSFYFAKPAFQHDRRCAMRTVADVAAVSQGVAVYDSYVPQSAGWGVAGGTAVAAAVVGGIYGLAGNAAQISDARGIYAHPGDLHDITIGANGTCGTSLCRATTGYDAPTGMGTPAGLGAF